MINDHRRFLYQDGVETGRIFEVGENIPKGWTDLPDSDEWDNPPAKPANENIEVDIEQNPVIDKKEDEPPKYPSQMNKEQLIEFASGDPLNITLNMSMTREFMLDKINKAMRSSEK